jgi:hypothetical protein
MKVATLFKNRYERYKCKAHGMQQRDSMFYYGEEASTAQRHICERSRFYE